MKKKRTERADRFGEAVLGTARDSLAIKIWSVDTSAGVECKIYTLQTDPGEEAKRLMQRAHHGLETIFPSWQLT